MKRMLLVISVVIVCMTVSVFAQTEEKSATTLKAEIQVCTGVTDRNPVGAGTTFGTDIGQIYCWSKVTGGSGEESIKHVWMCCGKVVAEVPLTIKGNSWRTWSAKKVLPSMTGEWEVKVVDASGNTVASTKFTIGTAKQ